MMNHSGSRMRELAAIASSHWAIGAAQGRLRSALRTAILGEGRTVGHPSDSRTTGLGNLRPSYTPAEGQQPVCADPGPTQATARSWPMGNINRTGPCLLPVEQALRAPKSRAEPGNRCVCAAAVTHFRASLPSRTNLQLDQLYSRVTIAALCFIRGISRCRCFVCEQYWD